MQQFKKDGEEERGEGKAHTLNGQRRHVRTAGPVTAVVLRNAEEGAEGLFWPRRALVV